MQLVTSVIQLMCNNIEFLPFVGKSLSYWR